MKTVGSRAEVWHGTAKKTSGGLLKKDLKKNKRGRIVSKKMSNRAKKEKRLEKAGYKTKKGVFKKFTSKKKGGDRILDRLKERKRKEVEKKRETEKKLENILSKKGNLQNKMHRKGHLGVRRAFRRMPGIRRLSKKVKKMKALNENERRYRDNLKNAEFALKWTDSFSRYKKTVLNRKNKNAARNVVTANMFNNEEKAYENKEKKAANLVNKLKNYTRKKSRKNIKLPKPKGPNGP